MKLSDVKARVARDADLVEWPLLDDNNEPVTNSKGEPVVWLLRGDQCAERRLAEDAENKKALARQIDDATPEDILTRRVAIAAACVGGWRGMEDEDGSDLKHSDKMVRAYLEADRKLLERTELRIRQRSRFLAGRSNSSGRTSGTTQRSPSPTTPASQPESMSSSAPSAATQERASS